MCTADEMGFTDVSCVCTLNKLESQVREEAGHARCALRVHSAQIAVFTNNDVIERQLLNRA